ncbi:helicase associated domain-containing protein [Cellulosimicrobium sp. Marseille-Q4280]|uniref:helicase associated domain-containing protein n=1 Tax=Cellulosimicrobium sp. Marseille-Q4280 TaxID=2937992 RepID=UPI00203D7538|nr:helicase associated domain-containing protein [Cellulosimicrobium sp. Marseille-Q4280]
MPAGVTTGGQFAAQARAEADVDLASTSRGRPPNEAVWSERVDALQSFVEDEARWPLRTSPDADEARLGRWLSDVRQAAVNGRRPSLTRPHRLEALDNAVPGWRTGTLDSLVDETGNIHGELTVLGRAAQRGDRTEALWRCRCTCGEEVVVIGSSLRRGATRSCGHLRKTAIDEAGKTYGELTVLRRTQRDGNTSAFWLCQCSCGRQTTVYGGALRSGSTRSCGHLKRLT